MSKDIRVIREECCDIWNNLKDKTKMIDYLIESKQRIAELEAKLAEKDGQIKTRVATYEKQFIEQTDEIYKLQQQLAVKEAELGNVQRMYESATRDSAIYFKENIELREQLAEKENTITTLIEDSKASKELLKKEIEELKEQRHIYLTRSVDECDKITMLELELQHKDQDKISFCIEQLEKVKEFCFEKRTVDDFGVLTITVDEDLGTSDNLLHFIDNQIKELKEGK